MPKKLKEVENHALEELIGKKIKNITFHIPESATKGFYKITLVGKQEFILTIEQQEIVLLFPDEMESDDYDTDPFEEETTISEDYLFDMHDTEEDNSSEEEDEEEEDLPPIKTKRRKK